MAKRIISYHLNYDIICLQEANYLNADIFPKRYTVLFSERGYSKNGIARNQERFDLVKPIGDILGRAFAIPLKDKKNR